MEVGCLRSGTIGNFIIFVLIVQISRPIMLSTLIGINGVVVVAMT